MAIVPKSDRATIINVASAIAGPFKLTFRLFDDDALAVFVNDLPREDFTISSAYVDGYDADATITFDTALQSGDVVHILGDMTPARANDYVNGPGLTEKMNIELGRLWATISDIKRDTNRSIKFFQSVSPVGLSANKTIMVNEGGDGVEMGPDISDLDSVVQEARDWAESETPPNGTGTMSALMAAKVATVAALDSKKWAGVAVDAGVERFAARSALVAHVAGNEVIEGREYRAEGLSYIGRIGATDIADLPDLVPGFWITPKHFGALADGVTDDTDAFNAAVTSLPVTGGEVFVPQGTYRVSSVKLHGADNLHSNVTLRLEPGAVIKKLAHADIATDAGRKGNVVEALYGDGHKVFGGKVEGNLSNGGFTPPYCTKHTLGNTFGIEGRNISVAADGTSSTGAATDDVYQITAIGAGKASSATNISDDVANGYVTKVYTQSTGVGAYNEADGSGYLNSYELDNDFAYRHCIYMNGLSAAMDACEVSGVECTDAVYGGVLVGAGPLFASEAGFGTTNGSITDCYVHDNGATNIGGGKKVKATISGNRVGTTDSSGIRCDEGSHDCVITGNIIDCNDIPNSNGGVSVYKSNRVTVTGNFITRANIGVSINESDFATVTANNVKDVGTGVSLSKCDNGSVTANIIDITTADGIKMTNGSNNAVAGNSLSNIGGTPITDTSAASIISGNSGAPATRYNQNTLISFATGGTIYLGGAAGAENFQVTPGAGTIVNRMVARGGAGGASTAPSLAVEGTSTDIDMRFLPKGAGKLRFGSHSAIGAETVTGYIEIKDASGTVRKIAVVS